MQKSLLLAALIATAILSGCSKNMASNTYVDSSTPGKVIEGKILSMRAVTIKAHDKLQDNTLGGLGGGAAGLAAGSTIGHGSGNVAADIGGAVIGAVAGAYLQDSLSSTEGEEYIVKIDKQYIQEYKSIYKKISTSGKETVEQDMTSANVGAKTDIISVVQEADPALKVGSHIYIIYNDDRPRLVAQQ